MLALCRLDWPRGYRFRLGNVGESAVSETLIIGMGEIGIALASHLENVQRDFSIVARRRRVPTPIKSSISRFRLINLGVDRIPGSLLDGVSTILYAAGTPQPSAPLSATSVVVANELVPLQALITAIEEAKWQGTFVFASSGGTIYGRSPLGTPWKESDSCHPISAYGIAKYAAENLLAESATRGGFKLIIARISNIVGTRLNFASGIGFVQTAVHRALKDLPIEIFGDGSITRDFIDVADVAAILANLNCDGGDAGFVINVSSGVATSLTDVVALVEHESRTSAKVIYSPRRSSDLKNNLLSNAKLNLLKAPTYTPLVTSIQRLIIDFSNL